MSIPFHQFYYMYEDPIVFATSFGKELRANTGDIKSVLCKTIGIDAPISLKDKNTVAKVCQFVNFLHQLLIKDKDQRFVLALLGIPLRPTVSFLSMQFEEAFLTCSYLFSVIYEICRNCNSKELEKKAQEMSHAVRFTNEIVYANTYIHFVNNAEDMQRFRQWRQETVEICLPYQDNRFIYKTCSKYRS